MIKRYIAITLSMLGIFSAVMLALTMSRSIPAAEIFEEPSKNPFMTAISASGIIEAVRENVSVGIHESGIIDKVYKEVAETVKKGEPLLGLDTRELASELKVKQAKVKVARAKLAGLKDQYDRLKSVQDLRAVSVNEVKTKENDVSIAESELEEATADLALIETKIERMTLRAPRDGTIIQRRAREGEFLSTNGRDPPFIIGDLTELQIRADIDEQNASWLKTGSKAIAFPKNRPDKSIPLKFVRIEPYVIPKKSLTGLSDERVDTRVLQVIYTLDPPKDFALYIGQQVDVYIEMEERS